MKKLALLAIAAVVGASFSTAGAAKKNKKDKKDAPVENVITLSSSQDTLSYAAGVARTEGLIPYLEQGLKVDTAYMADFVRGYNDVVAKGENKAMTAYAAGMQIAQMVQQRMLPALEKEFEGYKDTINVEKFHAGFTGALCPGKALMADSLAKDYFKAQSDLAIKAQNMANQQAGIKFLEENKTKPGVQTTASGLQYKVITMGTGATPKTTDEVKVNYEGRLIDGTVFDSSYKRKQPTTFRADKVIAGWTEALTMMPVGSKWEIYIPYDLAYGERQAGQLIKPFSTLVFTVELLGINEAKDEAEADAKDGTKLIKPSTTGKKLPVTYKATPSKTTLKAKR